MKKIFSNYYKIILSVVILIVLVALKEDYKTSFDGMSGVRTVVRMLLYTAWGFLLATRTRRDKAKGAEYVAFGVACVAALNLLIPIWSFQIAFYAFVAGVPGLYFMVFILTGILGGYLWGPRGYRIRDDFLSRSIIIRPQFNACYDQCLNTTLPFLLSSFLSPFSLSHPYILLK